MVVMVDVTTISPLVQKHRKYTLIPGKLADTAVKTKEIEYSKHFTTLSTREAALWFFAIETNGVFSKEAREFCRLMAETAGSPRFSKQYIKEYLLTSKHLLVSKYTKH